MVVKLHFTKGGAGRRHVLLQTVGWFGCLLQALLVLVA